MLKTKKSADSERVILVGDRSGAQAVISSANTLKEATFLNLPGNQLFIKR